MISLFFRIIRFVENSLCSIGLMITTILVFAQVVNRYWLHLEIMWIGDLALYIFVFTVFITIALTTRERGHTAVEMLQEKLFRNRPFAGKIYYFIRTMASLAVLCIFFPAVHRFFIRAMKYPEYGTLVRWFNTSWLVYSLFAMVILIIFHLMYQLTEDWIEISQTRRSSISKGDEE